MKKVLFLSFLFASSSVFSMTEKAQKELEKAMTGDYQTLRNVAFSMKDGTFGHDKNPISACALRKVILLVNQDKVDMGDYANEYVDCKNLSMAESQQAWEIAIQSIPIILKHKK